jgi:hypothetical protein
LGHVVMLAAAGQVGEAARLVLSGEAIDIARQLRDRAERTIRPKK